MNKKLIIISLFCFSTIIFYAFGQKANTTNKTEPLKIMYKLVDSTELYLYFYYPANYKSGEKLSAIVFFFGGGWNSGSVEQFTPHAQYFASRGMIGITAEYRVRSRNYSTPFNAVSDAKSAIRFLRANVEILGIDSEKIVGSGGSAGGHIAAAAGMIDGLEEAGEDLSISSCPDALVLFNPVFDNGPGGYGYDRVGDRYKEISPIHNITPGDPPAILFFGTEDKLIPVKTIKEFQSKMQVAGNQCELFLYEGKGHGFFNFKYPEYYKKTVFETDKFLISLGFLEGKNENH